MSAREFNTNVVSELRKSKRRASPAVRRWVGERYLADLHISVVTVLEFELGIARLHVPDPRPERDALIAATASAHNLAVVTRNVADFVPMGVVSINPWQE